MERAGWSLELIKGEEAMAISGDLKAFATFASYHPKHPLRSVLSSSKVRFVRFFLSLLKKKKIVFNLFFSLLILWSFSWSSFLMTKFVIPCHFSYIKKKNPILIVFPLLICLIDQNQISSHVIASVGAHLRCFCRSSDLWYYCYWTLVMF